MDSRQQQLSETLRRASEIAASKAKKARAQERRGQRRYTWLGVLFILAGVMGGVGATITGLAQTLGVFCTTGVAIASIALGGLVLSSNPHSQTPPQNSYAVQALELAQMSAALKA